MECPNPSHSVFMSNLVLQVLYVLSVNVESIRIYQILEQLKDDSIGLDLRQGFDIERDPVFGDFTSDVGFMKATELVLRLVEYGLLFGGLPCASFGFLSSPTHLRSAMEPWGNLKFPFVWSGNIFASRFSLLVCLCLVRKCTWMLEQPGKTTLPLLPPIRLLLQPNLKPRLIRWRGTQIFPTVWNWINFGHLLVRWGICFCYVAKVDGPDGWLDIKATAWSRQCAKVSIDYVYLQNMEISNFKYYLSVFQHVSCGPSLGHGLDSYQYQCPRHEGMMFRSGRMAWENKWSRSTTISRKALWQCYLVRKVVVV